MTLRPTGTTLAVLAVVLLSVQLVVPDPGGGTQRPNLVVIVTDDQRAGSMDLMPATETLLFDEGIRFRNAFVTTPVCCPSRASILTGRMAHNHGVLANTDPLTVPTVVDALHEAGYFTGHVGKYLNSWDGSNRSEFDRWVAFPGGNSSYLDPTLHVGDEVREVEGYITDLLGQHAGRFVEEAATREAPFLLLFAPNAPHLPAIPAPEDDGALSGQDPHRPPSYLEEDTSDKPRWVQEAGLNRGERDEVDRWQQGMAESLLSLDRTIAELHHTLATTGQLETTAIIYLSDNGFLWGEHGLRGKGVPYDEAVRVPMALTYPPRVEPGQVRSQVVANIDVAPTLYELAGLPVPATVDGRSLLDLLEDQSSWREGILLEAWSVGRPWRAIHTGDEVYIETRGDREEYYDLTTDPYQLENLYGRSEHRDRVRALDALLTEQVEATVATPWPDEGP